MLNNQFNLFFIITDQQRYDAVGYQNNIVQTPNINKLAAQSLICNHAVVQSPQCQPSRASLLTGYYPDNINMWWNDTKLDLKYQTIGNILSDNGYRTGYFGKLHIDSDLDYKLTAKHYGFNDSYLTEDWLTLLTDKRDEAVIKRVKREFYSPMRSDYGLDMPSDYLAPWCGKLSSPDMHHEDIITKEAIKFISQPTRQPFACFIGFHGPHPPYCSPAPYHDLYKYGDIPLPDNPKPTWFGYPLNKTDWHHIKAQYYGAISWIDSYIGQLLNVINMNNTVIIFTSDHGDILGDHGYFSKGIFTYEGNVRVPLIIKSPELPVGYYDHIVQLIDLYPTIISLLHLKTNNNCNGVDLSNYLSTNKQANQFAYSAISTNPRHYMIKDRYYKYCTGQYEFFYDLIEDPMENHNLINYNKYRDKLNEYQFSLYQFMGLLNNEHAYERADIKLRSLHNRLFI